MNTFEIQYIMDLWLRSSLKYFSVVETYKVVTWGNNARKMFCAFISETHRRGLRLLRQHQKMFCVVKSLFWGLGKKNSFPFGLKYSTVQVMSPRRARPRGQVSLGEENARRRTPVLPTPPRPGMLGLHVTRTVRSLLCQTARRFRVWMTFSS